MISFKLDTEKKRILLIVFSVLLVLCFVFSGVYLLLQQSSVRRVFSFPVENTAKNLYTEIRDIPEGNSIEENVTIYIKELLLGPQHHDVLPLVPRNTSLTNCFIRENAGETTLFVEIDEKALLPGRFIAENGLGLPLLEKNVFTNFKNIDTMYLYISGHLVYEDKDLTTEEKVDRFLKRNMFSDSKK